MLDCLAPTAVGAAGGFGSEAEQNLHCGGDWNKIAFFIFLWYHESTMPKAVLDYEQEKDEIVLRASLTKPALFRILVSRYQEAFLRKAKTVVRTDEEAEDIVQETFVKIYRNAKSFEKRPGIEFKSWGYKILMNTSFTHYTKLQRTKGNMNFEDYLKYDEEIPDGEDYATHQELKHTVQGVLQKMPSHLASALHAYYFEDKSYQDIADEQHISLSALKLRMFRAKKIFRKLLEA